MIDIKSTVKDISSKIKKTFSPITTPISNFLAPYQTKWDELVLPITSNWASFKEKSPKLAIAISWTLRLTKWGIGLLFTLILLTMLNVFGKMPNKEELMLIENANASEVYSLDGVMIGKYYTENRTTIKLDSISPYLITALLAIEDKRFFEHSGIDLRSWMRVFKGLVSNSGEMGGGSTLSQQLVKNLYPRKNYRIPGVSILINKIRENIISIRLEKIYNKEELLTMYLNTVPFGGNRFGIKEASRYFYNVRPKYLGPEQAATLIGMLKATTALDPTRNPKNSEKRRNLVLSQMLKNKDFRFESTEMSTISEMINIGVITQNEYDSLIVMPIGAVIHEDIGNNDGLGTYFREYLRVRVLPNILKDLVKEDGTAYNLYTDGLKITTTLDSRMQTHAENAVFKHMSYLQGEFVKHWKGYKEEKPWGDDKWIDEQVKRSERYQQLKEASYSDEEIDSVFKTPAPMTVFFWDKKPTEIDTMMTPLDSVRYYFTMLNCGFMAMEHANGYIKSWVGGTDFKYFKYDHILSSRQAGSTFKPIVYTAALQDSIKPCDYIKNEVVTIEDWSPRNSDESYGGWFSVIGGLTYSANVIVAQLIEKVGIQKTIDLAAKLGVTAQLPREFGISLGAADVTLFDMMKVYGTFGNKGVRPEPISVLKIVDRYGKVIYDYEELLKQDTMLGPNVRAMEVITAATMTRMMQSVIIYGTGNNLRSQFCPHGDFAGKTGTTQNHADGWFMAYNPKLVTGAWVGGPSPAVRFRSMGLGSGAAMALPIVGNFWYSIAIDPKSAKITQEKFEANEVVNALVSCPFRIGISPDTLLLLMQDTLLKDSLIRSGFKNLREITNEKFGIILEVEEGGEEIDPLDELNGEKDPADKKGNNPDPLKSTDPKSKDKKKQEDPKSATKQEKEPPKKSKEGGGI